MSITTREELDALRHVGRIVRRALEAMRAEVRPGVTTAALDAAGARVLAAHGARSAPRLVYGFPGVNCISVNDEIVHGVGSSRVLREGDLVKLDVTAEKDGFMADAAITVVAGRAPARARALVACAERALRRGLAAARAGRRAREVGAAVERVVEAAGFSVVRALQGHGIGRTIHEEPSIPNWDDPEARAVLTPGLVVTVEPIVSAGSGDAVGLPDGWTVRTRDGSLAAHAEHTVVITRGAPLLLTAA
uniref:Methionine aminopeptidase n=1 Tax=Eiseniibacteriota bacterium TaxID=2212470 RepID=A0A832I2A6_UNCEI